MSTIRMKKDHGDRKAKETYSVPFGVGKDLIALGVAEYPNQPSLPRGPSGGTKADAAAEKRIKDLEAENARLKEENAELKGEVEELLKAEKADKAKQNASGAGGNAGAAKP